MALVWELMARCIQYAHGQLAWLSERRRMIRTRRDPNALVNRLVAARRVLIVCYGNIIRSPFTAALIAQAVDGSAAFSIASAGLGAVTGRSAHPTAILAARKRGIDLNEHAAALVTEAAVAAADVIFLMDIDQLAVLRRRFPEGRPKAFLLTSLAPGTALEISDPVDGDEMVFEACFDHISSAVRPIVGLLSALAQHA